MKYDGTIKNFRIFNKRLCKAADDKNAGQMFFDNVRAIHEKNVIDSIKAGEFKEAVLRGFRWDKSKEGYKFWGITHERLEDFHEINSTAPGTTGVNEQG